MNDGVINELIPADELHWSDEDQKLCVLEGDEIDQILMACCNNCHMTSDDDFDEIMRVVRWIEQVKTDQLLLKQFLAGNIVITRMGEDGPHFMRKDKFDECIDSFQPPE